MSGITSFREREGESGISETTKGAVVPRCIKNRGFNRRTRARVSKRVESRYISRAVRTGMIFASGIRTRERGFSYINIGLDEFYEGERVEIDTKWNDESKVNGVCIERVTRKVEVHILERAL